VVTRARSPSAIKRTAYGATVHSSRKPPSRILRLPRIPCRVQSGILTQYCPTTSRNRAEVFSLRCQIRERSCRAWEILHQSDVSCARASGQSRVMVDEGGKRALSTSVRRFHPHCLSGYLPRLQHCSAGSPAPPFRTLPRPLDLGALISRRVLVSRHVSPRRINENILYSCSQKAFTWRNEVTGVSVFDMVVACL
jgi:hypothetical protein